MMRGYHRGFWGFGLGLICMVILFGIIYSIFLGTTNATQTSPKKTHKTVKTIDNNLPKIIIISSVILSLSLIYLATSFRNNGNALSDEEMSQKIDEGIQAFIKKQEQAAQDQQAAQNNNDSVISVSTDDDPILGDPNAPITMIEFSDYECPFCKKHYTQTFPQLKEEYIDKGLVKLVFRDYPLPFHDPLSTQESMAADCAREQGGDKVYFKYHNLIFDNTSSNGRGLEKSQLYDFAKQLSLNESKFKTCLDSEKYKDEVTHDIEDGQAYGVNGTPGFFINGRSIKGAYPFSEFKRIIDEELEKVK